MGARNTRTHAHVYLYECIYTERKRGARDKAASVCVWGGVRERELRATRNVSGEGVGDGEARAGRREPVLRR